MEMMERLDPRLIKRREWMKGGPAMDEEPPSDQERGFDPPQPVRYRDGIRLRLPRNFEGMGRSEELLSLVSRRTSCRRYDDAPLTEKELSYLLYLSQGVRDLLLGRQNITLRTVPSAGARHPLETYVSINRVEGLKPGIYHFLPVEHALEYLGDPEDRVNRLAAAFCGQYFLAAAPVFFIWTAQPYRGEWRYGFQAAKYALLDAGHACENLYLAAESIGCGACAAGAYIQEEADSLLGLPKSWEDPREEEFVIYAAAVGKRLTPR